MQGGPRAVTAAWLGSDKSTPTTTNTAQQGWAPRTTPGSSVCHQMLFGMVQVLSSRLSSPSGPGWSKGGLGSSAKISSRRHPPADRGGLLDGHVYLEPELQPLWPPPAMSLGSPRRRHLPRPPGCKSFTKPITAAPMNPHPRPLWSCSSDLGGVSLSQDRHNQVSHTGQFKTAEMYSLELWRPEF